MLGGAGREGRSGVSAVQEPVDAPTANLSLPVARGSPCEAINTLLSALLGLFLKKLLQNYSLPTLVSQSAAQEAQTKKKR